uniref:Reverse transcriptase domain-containing protein n=1 Tax=Amphimedon queenslandica TaxID=400682 RepID=A0A1X7TGJ2_AMPQE
MAVFLSITLGVKKSIYFSYIKNDIYISQVCLQEHVQRRITKYIPKDYQSDYNVKANLFNQFFSVFSSHSMTNQSQMKSTLDVCIGHVNILPAEVYKALTQLKTSKSMGIDWIGPVILKHCASALFLPLHNLFHQSLIHGVLPQEWKVHLITPVYKSGEKSDVKNYRPILLLCFVSKVLERLVFDHITTFAAPLITT